MPLDLNETPEEAKQFAQMARNEEPEPVEPPAPEPEAPEPAPAEPAAPKAPAEPAAPPVAADPKGEGHEVPLPVLLKERNLRKAAEAELARLRANPQPVTPPTPVAPLDPTQDPIAVIQRLQEQVDRREQQDRDHAQMSAFQQHVIAREQEYVATNPDYPKAVEFLKNARIREMKEGLGMSDQAIAQALSAEAQSTAQYALQNDLNPAEIFHNLAKVRGFTATVVSVPQQQAPATPDPAAVSKLASLRKGHEAAKSVSTGGGGGAATAPSLEAISQLEGAEFDAMWKNGTVKRLMQ